MSSGKVLNSPSSEAVVNEDPDGNGIDTTLNVRLPGQYYDNETGQHYNYQRDYAPRLGRYLTTDPLGFDGGSLNLYAYVNNDPINWVDPSGLILSPTTRLEIFKIIMAILVAIETATMLTVIQKAFLLLAIAATLWQLFAQMSSSEPVPIYENPFLPLYPFRPDGPLYPHLPSLPSTSPPPPISKPIYPVSPYEAPDFLHTPDSHPKEFERVKGFYRHNKKKYVMKENPIRHGGENWNMWRNLDQANKGNNYRYGKYWPNGNRTK